MNIFDLNKKIEQLQGMLIGLSEKEFYPIDYTDYIKQPLNNFTKLYKHKNVYYKSERDLFNKLNLEMDFRTFKAKCSSQELLWNYEVLIVYAAYKSNIGYYLVCDGKVLTKAKLAVVKGNPYNSEFPLMIEGSKVAFNRAISAYTTFVDANWKEGLYHIDGFYGNCSIDNLQPRTKT